MRKFLVVFITMFFLQNAFAQNFSNRGKEFWIPYSYHVGMSTGTPPTMTLSITSNVNTTYTVEAFGAAIITTGSIVANVVTTIIVPNTYFCNTNGLINNRAIRVTSPDNIVVYSFITRTQASAATLCLPTAVLGTQYIASSYTQISNEQNANSYITIIATDDNTNVEIIPSAGTVGGWLPGSINTITLNKGQIYQVLGTTTGNNGVDLSGSKIKSIASGTSNCKKIAVFSGSGKLYLGCTSGGADNLYQQLYPASSWGRRFLTVPSFNRLRNYFRIYRNVNTINVSVNGVAVPNASFVNNYYEFNNSTPNYIESDEPITVAQYFTTQGCFGNASPYDPDMIMLNPIEQNIDNVTLVSSAQLSGVSQHHIHLITKSNPANLASVRFDGVAIPAASWTAHPQLSGYSYAYRSNISLGTHNLQADSGFNALAYGYSPTESYGYSAGTNVKDLINNFIVQNSLSVLPPTTGGSGCSNAPFKLKISLQDSILSNIGTFAGQLIPTRYDSLKWNVNPTGFTYNGGQTFPYMVTPQSQATLSNPFIAAANFPPVYQFLVVRPDSTSIVNGKTISWYFFPYDITCLTTGTYNVKVTAYSSIGISECGTSSNEKDFDFQVTIDPPPAADFTFTQPGCVSDPVQFLETTPQTPQPTYAFSWNFGDPTSSSNTAIVRNPTHVFTSPTSFNVQHYSISVAGCRSATVTKTVTVPQLVNATLTGTTTVCQNAPQPNLTFTITPGLVDSLYKINYSLSTNGGAPVAQAPISTFALINTFPVPTTAAGTYLYSITSVENANPAFCTRPITNQTATVTVNPLPTATISGTATVCQNAAAQTITFTGANATAPYKFTYSLNGVTQPVLTSNALGVATISVTTAAALVNTYALVSVEYGTAPICTQAVTGQSAIVTVQQNPTATIAASAAAVCQDGTAPTVTLTASGGVAPYRFTYTVTVNGVTGSAVTVSSLTNTYVITVPLTIVGTLIYNLTTIENLTPITCPITLAGVSTTVNVNPVPSATISGTTSICQVAGAQTVTFTGAGGLGQYQITYAINGVTQATPLTTVANIATVSAPVTTAGTFVYEIVSVKDITTNCIKTYVVPNRPTATVTVQQTSTATISGTATVCQDATAPIITFTGANGVAPLDFVYTLTTNGVTGAPVTVSSTAPSLIKTITVPMTTLGTLVYNLVSVKNTGSINCTTPITGQTATVIINPVPTATISGTATVCQNTAASPITFVGAGGLTGSYIFNYTINGIAQSPFTGNNYVVNQSTTSPNAYIYVITSVQDASTPCVRNYSGAGTPTATVTVKQLATATIAASVPTVCQASTTLPVITFTATGGVAPYTFAYQLNGGANQTITTTTGNTVTLNLPTTTANTFIYTLVSVKESSVGGQCVNPQIGSAQVIVHPQPTASFTTSAPYCALKDVTFTPAGSVTPGSITSWVWNYANGTGANVRTNQLPFTINYATAGVKNVTYKTISDKGCESVLYTAPVTINSKPKAGFISPESCLADAFASFTDTSTVVGGTIVFWEWDFGDGTAILAGSGPTFQNPQHAYATVGLKTVKLIVTSNSGCKDTVQAQSFFINGEVTSADFTVQTPLLCSNRPVQIKENSVVNVGGLIRVQIRWDNVGAPSVVETDELPFPGKIYTHNYPNVQVDRTYQVRYIAYTGFDGTCQKEVTKSIVVRASPVAVFTTPIDVCLNGGPVVLNTGTASGGTGVYMGAGVTVAAGVYTFNPLAVGVTVGNTNNVTYAVTSPAGCDSALVRPIRVLAPPVVDTFKTLGNLCRINNITFHNATTNGSGTIVKWIYDWGDGSAIQTATTGADITHLYATAGPKVVTLTLETDYGCKNVPFTLNIVVNPLPVPTYTFTNSVCLPNANIAFTNTMANQASFNYVWSFELPSITGANTSVLPNPSHIYTTTGPYSTQMVATNNTTGCKDSTAVIVINSSTIHPAPVVQFNAIPDVCLNNGTVIINQASETSGIPLTGGAVYSGPGVSLSGGNYIFNPQAAGVVVGLNTITVTFTSTFGCPTVATKTVKVLAKPVVDVFTIVGNKCANNNTLFHNEITQGAGIVNTWIYNWGDGTPIQSVATGADINHFYTMAGTYNATLTLITDYGCKSDVKPLSVVINPLPLPNFNFTDTVCLPAGNVIFTNTTPNLSANTYSWVFNNTPPTINSSINTNFTYSAVGPHPVKLIATNATTFCVDSITRNVNSIHPAPIAKFDFSVPSVCIGTSVGVIDRSTFADGTGSRWDWNWGDAALAIGQSPAPHTYAVAQTYTVDLKITNSFSCFDDSAMSFTVHPFPVVNAGRDSVILQGGQLVLTPTVTGNDLTYLWTGTPAPINLSSTTILNPIASPVEDITYKLKVTARGGCVRTDEVFIKVLKAPVVPNTFTPNRADSRHNFWEIKYLSSYPDNRVQVFTRTGQLVFESRGYLTPWDGNGLNGTALPFDTYYYIIEPGTGRQPLTGYVTIIK
jgi:gliding motility-associated-like protein